MKAIHIVPVWDKTEEEWLQLRERGIGGSDAGTISGVNKYSSAYQLWSEKTRTTERSFKGNEATELGHELEPVIGRWYARTYNKAIVEWPVLIWSSDEDYSFMFANLDYVEVEPSEQFPAGVVTVWHSIEPPSGIIDIVECKTTGIATMGNAKAWSNNNVPPSYLVQGYHYGEVLASIGIDFRHVTFVCLIGGTGFVVRTLGKRPDDNIPWDDDVAENIKINESQFWDLVTYQIPPDIDGSEATSIVIDSLYPRSQKGKTLEADEELYKLVVEFETQKKAATKAAEKEQNEFRNKIVKLVGDAEEVTYGDQLILTFRTGADKTTFNVKRFQEEMPELYAKFLKTGPGARTLLPKV